MKKRILLSLLALPLLLINACNKSEDDVKTTRMTLEDVSSYLTTKLYENEVLYSNVVTSKEIDKRGETKTTTTDEVFNIYSDNTSSATGEQVIVYTNTEGQAEEKNQYSTLHTVKTFDSGSIFFLIRDWADDELNSYRWYDSADRLAIVETGDANYDGIEYLLSSSVPGQLSKQATLLTNRFIATYFTGNPDLQMALPSATKKVSKGIESYSVLNFSYSTNDDSSTVTTTTISFEFTVKNDRLLSSYTNYTIEFKRGEETHTESLITTYDLSYDSRVESSTNADLLDPVDYYINRVDSISTYKYYNGEKQYLDFNNLPLESFINFEAKEYAPSKAVDTHLYPVSTSNPDVIAISGSSFETKSSGVAEVVVTTTTGIGITIPVRVNIPEITRIKITETSSGIETESTSEGTKRYIYTNTTYTGIYLSVNPSGALLDDVEITVSDPNVLEVEITSKTSKMYELKYTVLNNNDNKSVDVTFTSKTNPDVKTVVTYTIKDRLSEEELFAKLTSNTYRWDSIYDKGVFAIITFDSNTQATLTYYRDSTDNVISTTYFTYSINETSFTPSVSNLDAYYKYNSGDITLDGEKITLRVNVTDYVHYFEIVGE